MNRTLWANISPTGETVITYLLLAVLFTIIDNFFRWSRCWVNWTNWKLGFFPFLSCSSRCIFSKFFSFGRQFDDGISKCSEFSDCWVVQKSFFSTNFADINLNDTRYTSLDWPLIWICSAKALAAQLMQGSWTQLSISIWSLGLLQRLQF